MKFPTRKEFKKDFGEKCTVFSPLCVVCVAWHAWETLEDLYNLKNKYQHIKGFKEEDITKGRIIN